MRISTSQIYERALNNLLTQQTRATKLQTQLASGLRVQTPSDDPIAAAQIELMNQRVSSAESLQKNREAVENALKIEEAALSDMVSTLQRLREMQIQAGSGVLSEADRHSLATEAQSLLKQLQDQANAKDNYGYYMFSGGRSSSPAITLDNNGAFVYNGDGNQRFQAVSGNLQIAANDTGDNLFMRIKNGNGRFTVTVPTPNAGTGVVTSGEVVNEGAYVADNYTISFANNSQGKLVVMISGATSGNVIPPSGLTDDAPLYEDGREISFNGMSVTASGQPVAGDSFALNPAKNESLFSTVQRMIVNLNKPFNSAVDKAATLTEYHQVLAQLDAAQSNILNYQAIVGSRLTQLDSANQTNSILIDSSKEVLKQLSEIDPAVVATKYNEQLINLQAAQQSFVKIQGLSIFNFI
ncbi:MAG: flagellar hook-associated protein 3 [Legionella sp.]|nr:MAG: flagellar hook-associated protein 3 [Legionella sp.]